MRNKWIYSTVLALALCLLGVSCSDGEMGEVARGKTRTLTFTLAVDNPVAQSRATWEDDYDDTDAKIPFDTRIRLDDLQIVIYDANNTYVGKAENVLYWPVSGDANASDNTKEEYQFVGDVSNLTMKTGDTYKVMIFANCQEVKNDTQINTLSYGMADIAYDTGYIPMWGVKSFSLTDAELQDLQMIHLLRAAAKVEVKLSEELTGFTLTKVTLNNHNNTGYCLPDGWDKVGDTSDIDQETCIHEYDSDNEPLTFIKSTADGSYFVYLPEYDNELSTEAKITVELQHGNNTNDIHTYTDAIRFTTYTNGVSDGTPYDIVRNHIYRFTITGVHTGGLLLAYEVADWEKVEIPTYEFTYPTYTNPLMPLVNIDSYTNNDIAITELPNPTMEYKGESDESGAFVCAFQMTAPSDQQWLPVVGMGNNLCKIKVYQGGTLMYDSSNTDAYPASKLVASNDWYTIKVIPTGQYNSGDPQVVELGITYHQAWMGDSGSRYLLINGEGNEIYWKTDNNDIDPRVIRIHQVSGSTDGDNN